MGGSMAEPFAGTETEATMIHPPSGNWHHPKHGARSNGFLRPLRGVLAGLPVIALLVAGS